MTNCLRLPDLATRIFKDFVVIMKDVGIRPAIKRAGGDLFAMGIKVFAFLPKQSIDTPMAPFIVRGGMHNDGAVGFSVQRDGGFKATILRRRAFAGGWRLIECAQINPAVGTNGIVDGAAAFLVGGRQPGQKFYVFILGDVEVVGVTKAESAT